ncbi:MAG: signal peptidase II [Cyanobacteria bacterium J069]
MRIKNFLFWAAALLGVVFDQITKMAVVQNFELTDPPQTLPLWAGVFHLTYVTNKGAAFSWFSEDGSWLRWLSLGVSLALAALALWGARMPRWEQLGYGLIMAGAVGNGIDRFRFGEVVDFLDFRLIRFPIFNFADVFINLGIICLLIVAFGPLSSEKKS